MTAKPPPALKIEGLKKSFHGRPVLDGVDLSIPKGSIFTVLGPSGAGKSVFLKCIAHVIVPDAGRVEFEGRAMESHDRASRADFRRRCGFLFQGNALFDSLTALENVALPLEQTTNLPAAAIRERAREALRQLDIADFESRHPAQLSGGMQKRLALARAIVTHPDIVLFDEPTAGLDPLRRNAVFAMIAKYRRRLDFTALVVTHDVPEALATSDRVALLGHGRIAFEGTPGEFASSNDANVAAFRDSTAALRETLRSFETGEAL